MELKDLSRRLKHAGTPPLWQQEVDTQIKVVVGWFVFLPKTLKPCKTLYNTLILPDAGKFSNSAALK